MHLTTPCNTGGARHSTLFAAFQSELKDLEENMIPMAMAMAPQMSGGGDNAAEVEKLKAEIKRKDQHIEALKGLVNVQVTPRLLHITCTLLWFVSRLGERGGGSIPEIPVQGG